VNEAFSKNQDIAFNTGSHRELLRLAYHDYENLVKPTVARFSYQVP
jgi:Ala-tRNA(Pro) deacylase